MSLVISARKLILNILYCCWQQNKNLVGNNTIWRKITPCQLRMYPLPSKKLYVGLQIQIHKFFYVSKFVKTTYIQFRKEQILLFDYQTFCTHHKSWIFRETNLKSVRISTKPLNANARFGRRCMSMARWRTLEDLGSRALVMILQCIHRRCPGQEQRQPSSLQNKQRASNQF